METHLFVLVWSLLCSGATQQELTKGVPKMYVREGEDVVLHCSSGESLENTVIHWKNQHGKEVFFCENRQCSESGQSDQDEQYKGHASLFYDELKKGNASLILRNTKIEYTGTYTCVLPHLSSGLQSSTMELIVEPVFKNRFLLEKGAVNAPYLKIVRETKAGVELQCVVRGSSSKPSVAWETCEGVSLNATGQTVSETRGRYDATLLVNATTTETNCFRCVVQQEDIYHRVDDEIAVSEKLFTRDSDSGRGCDEGFLVGVGFAGAGALALLQVLALVLYFNIKRHRSRRQNVKNEENGNCNTAGKMEMSAISGNTANGGTDTNSVENGPVNTEEAKLMPTNKTSGERR